MGAKWKWSRTEKEGKRVRRERGWRWMADGRMENREWTERERDRERIMVITFFFLSVFSLLLSFPSSFFRSCTLQFVSARRSKNSSKDQRTFIQNSLPLFLPKCYSFSFFSFSSSLTLSVAKSSSSSSPYSLSLLLILSILSLSLSEFGE